MTYTAKYRKQSTFVKGDLNQRRVSAAQNASRGDLGYGEVACLENYKNNAPLWNRNKKQMKT